MHTGLHFRVRLTAPQGPCRRELFDLAQDQIALKTARYYIIIIFHNNITRLVYGAH